LKVFKFIFLNTVTKYITSKTLQPAVKKYLTKTRTYQYKNISLLIPPGVFHPGLFFSTKILLNYILQLDLNNKTILELGAGSGLISFAAAQKNAIVTATDISELAIEYLYINSERNQIPINIIHSDLFENIQPQQFDIIVINPPYYKKNPQTRADYAWYCGENGEYFHKLFGSLKNYINDQSSVLMILSEECDIELIKNIADRNSFSLKLVHSKKSMLEQNFIFSIEKARLNFNNYTLIDNVYVNVNTTINKLFEEKYIKLRQKENRVYTENELKHLPSIEKKHLHYKEWILRTQSANRLFEYLAKKNKALRVLEVGCGNGWLSNFLARAKNNSVVGLDVNFTELKQAQNVFKKQNLFFVYDALSEEFLSHFNFDIAVFAASAQYFPSIEQTIQMILLLLNKGGEVHILDTNFYKAEDVEAAHKRTKEYYLKLGFPEFEQYYHHHSFDELKNFCVDKLYDPSAVKNIFSAHKNPFPWLRIKMSN
jgi:release factor glutamine methyltransferase